MKAKFKSAHIYRRTISLLLSIVLLFLAIPQIIFAEIRSAADDDADTTTESTKSTVNNESAYSYNVSGDVYELEDRREASVKHFHTEDGSIVAAQYPTDVHILDGNGKWQDIDNTLSDLGSEYGTGNTGIKFAKKITGNESIFTIHDGNGKITMSLVGAIKKTEGTVIANTAEDGDGTKLGKLMNLENLSSRIIYENILPGVDLEYVTEGRNVKENIIVKEQLDTYSFTFTVKLNNLEAELLSDGSIRIFDGEGETVFSIPAPVTYDAAGNYAPAEATYFTLEQTGNSTYALTVTTDSEWMNAEDRVYPVTVDPTLSTLTSNMVDTYVASSYASTNYSSNISCYVSGNSNNRVTYWKTTSLPTIPSSAYITDATLSLYALYASASFNVGIYNVTSNWDSTLTWSTYSAGTAGAVATSMCDYVCISAGSDDKWYTWDITDIVDAWYSGTSNYGICLKQANTVSGYVYFASANYSTASYRPVFSVTYRDIKGLESYYSYLSQDLGLAGTGYVNIATGKTTITNGTLTTTDSLFGFTPTLVYNSNLAGKSYSHENAQVPYSASETKTPYGFKWNFQETIIEKTYVNVSGTTVSYYVLADADGTEHAFFDSGVTENGVKIYHDEDSLQLKLYVKTSDIVIKDLNKIERHYTKATFSDYGVSAWYLTSIVDAPGNKLDFTWRSGTYLPASVRVTPKGRSTVTMLEFLYTSDNIPYAIYNPASKDAVIFRYSESPQGSLSTFAWQYLRIITWVKYTSSENIMSYYNSTSTTGITVLGSASYNYMTNKYLTHAYDALAGYQVVYGPDSITGEIFCIMEYASGILGQSLYVMLYDNYTMIQGSGSDDTIGTSDDIYTYYTCDKDGRVVSSYTKNSAGELYGASYGAYSEKASTKNNVKHRFSIDRSTVNLLLNGGFGTTLNSYPYWTITGDVNLSEDGPKFSQSTSGSTRKVSQSVTLPAGTYTLSVDLSTVNAKGSDIKLSAVGTNSEHNFVKSIPINESSDITGKQNYNMTFTSQSADTFVISLAVNGTSMQNMSVTVHNMALEHGISASEATLVNMGGFDNLTSGASVTDYWQNESGNFTVSTDSVMFGNVAAITGSISTEKYVKQTVAEFDFDEQISNKRYFISGFGKASSALINSKAKFAIRADVYYYTSTGTASTNPETHRFDFCKNNIDWQFVSGAFETKDGEYIQKIVIMCEYAYQPYGTAYFDNISVCEENGSFTEYEYYENGLVYLEKTASNTTYYEYDADGSVIRVADNTGNLTDYVYDDKGNLTRQLDSYFVNNENSDVEADDYPLCPKDANGKFDFANFNADDLISKTPMWATDYEYDIYGYNTSITSYRAEYSREDFVPMSNTKKMTSSYVYETSSGSRIFGALLSETDSAGREVRYYYNSTNGYLMASINVTDGNGTAYTYDDLGNLVSVMPATYTSDTAYSTVTNAENVAYTYDEHNRLSTVVTDSTTYTFAYDVFGNSSSIGVGTNTLASYEYNFYNGKLKKLNYANGVSVEYVYDDLDNVKEIWYTENEGTPTLAYSYTYTAKGQLYSLEDHINSRTTVYEYDRNGRVVAMSEYDSEELVNVLGSTVTYNSESLVSNAHYALDNAFSAQGDNVSWDYSYRYTENRMLQQMIFSSSVAMCIVNYVYDALYRPWYKSYYYNTDSNSASDFYITQEYQYKDYGENTGIEIETFGTRVNRNTALTFTYTYDSKGNITKIVGSDGSEYRYVYDDLGQLIREDNTEIGNTYIYTYDNAGNITSKEIYYLTDADETLGNSTSEFYYAYSDTSWADKLTSYRGRSFTYDELGNPLSYYNGISYNFTWVQGRRLESISRGSSSNAITFTYNSEGIRTSKTVNGITKNYILNGTQILGETWSDGTTIVYIYDAEGAAMGMLYRESTYAEGEYDTFLYERNLQGDVIAVYDGEGTKLISYAYDAWGNTITTIFNNATNTGAQYNPFTYRGYYRDTETGFYYLNSRYYDPVIGRFINTTDDIFVSCGKISFNAYTYSGNQSAISSLSLSIKMHVNSSSVLVPATVIKSNDLITSDQVIQAVVFLYSFSDQSFSISSTVLEYVLSSKNIPLPKAIERIGKIAPYVNAGLSIAISAYENFNDDTLSQQEQIISFIVDANHIVGQTVGSHFLAAIPYAGPALSIAVPIAVDWIWCGEISIFGFTIDVPDVVINEKTPEEWVKHFVNYIVNSMKD